MVDKRPASATLEDITEKTYNIAIIGGTGFAETPDIFQDVETDSGKVRVYELDIAGMKVAYLLRHDWLEVPDLVKKVGNAQALYTKGVKKVIAVSAVGRLSEDVEPGHLVIVDDLYEHNSRNRNSTTVPGMMAFNFPPYLSGWMNKELERGWTEKVKTNIEKLYDEKLPVELHKEGSGVYYTVPGPRFLTETEEGVILSNFANWKWNQDGSPIDIAEKGKLKLIEKYAKHLVVGQNVDESLPLKEYGIEYTMIAMCTDYSTTPPPEANAGHHELVRKVAPRTGKAAFYLIEEALEKGNFGQKSDLTPLWMRDEVDYDQLLSFEDRDGEPQKPMPILAQHIANYFGDNIQDKLRSYEMRGRMMKKSSLPTKRNRNR